MYKIAIITSKSYRSPLFLAQGLSRMLVKLGIKNKIFTQGSEWLHATKPSTGYRAQVKRFLSKKRLLEISHYDIFVVVGTVGWLREIELFNPLLILDKPILFYQVFYLGGSPYWLKKTSLAPLDIFDGFLGVSGIHDANPIKKDRYYHIGMDLVSSKEFNCNRCFVALLDFERDEYKEERRLHKKILDKLNIRYVELIGEYTFNDIEELYSKVALSFVATPESFGVPITQLQLYGSKIISPSKQWVKRHAMLPTNSVFHDDVSTTFSNNFIFYEDEMDLEMKLEKLKRKYVPKDVRGELLLSQPELVQGNLENLWEAISKIE